MKIQHRRFYFIKHFAKNTPSVNLPKIDFLVDFKRII